MKQIIESKKLAKKTIKETPDLYFNLGIYYLKNFN